MTNPELDDVVVADVTFHELREPDPELREPGRAERVAAVRQEMAQADRQYAMSLAMVRKAVALTQTEVAGRLGIGQSAVVRTEKADDMLVSTLRKYLEGVGTHLSLLVTMPDGHSVELSLADLAVSGER